VRTVVAAAVTANTSGTNTIGWIVSGLAVVVTAAAAAACRGQWRVRRRTTVQHGQLRRGLVMVLACLRLWTPQIGAGAHIEVVVVVAAATLLLF